MAEDPIRCMQLPLDGLQILVPNAVVAEIIGYAEPEHPGEEAGLRGEIHWRGVMVPVVSVEELCGLPQAEPGPRSRIAIIYQPDGDSELPYLGIILRDIPRGYLADEGRMQLLLDGHDCPYLLGRADPMLDHLMVPDLDALFDVVRRQRAA
jgi:chemosensory pili system protein ChpC